MALAGPAIFNEKIKNWDDMPLICHIPLKSFCVLAGVMVGLTQTHVFFLTGYLVLGQTADLPIFNEAREEGDFCKTFALVFKGVEFVEATVSACVQGYNLVWDSDLSSRDVMELRVSILISALALSSALTLCDKEVLVDTDEPRIKSVFSRDFVLFYCFRFSEVTLSFGSILLFQLITRPYGGFVAFFCMWIISGFMLVWLACKNSEDLAFDVFLDQSATVGFFGLVSIPLVFVQMGPVSSEPRAMLKCTPMPLPYFAFRCTGFLTLIVSGGPSGMVDMWLSYTRSAVYMSIAVAVAAVFYPMTFCIIRRRYRQE